MAALVGIAALTVAIVPVFGIQIGQASSSSLAGNGEAHDTLVDLKARGVGTGVLTTMNLPALVSLFGSWNWWLPSWVATILREDPSPMPTREIAPVTRPAASVR